MRCCRRWAQWSRGEALKTCTRYQVLERREGLGVGLIVKKEREFSDVMGSGEERISKEF